MESTSHITGEDDSGGGGEGCNSCESGWTMYLASPMHMHGHDDDAGGSGKSSGSQGSSVDDGYGYMICSSRGKKQGGYQDYADADDDDSLASDASTGPAKVKSPSPSSLPEHQQHGKQDEDYNDGHGKEEQEEATGGARAKQLGASSRKKAAAGNGKVDKGGGGGGGGEGNSSRRGHSKRGGGSSRRSFFLW